MRRYLSGNKDRAYSPGDYFRNGVYGEYGDPEDFRGNDKDSGAPPFNPFNAHYATQVVFRIQGADGLWRVKENSRSRASCAPLKGRAGVAADREFFTGGIAAAFSGKGRKTLTGHSFSLFYSMIDTAKTVHGFSRKGSALPGAPFFVVAFGSFGFSNRAGWVE